MANDIGSLLLNMQAPPSNLPMSPIPPGAPGGPPAPVPTRGAGLLDPLVRLMQGISADPNKARAFQAAGLALLNSGKDESTVRSFARAAQQGMQTLDQGRQRDKAEQAAAADADWKKRQEERRTAAQEKQTAIQQEAARREFMLRMEELKGNNEARKRAAEMDLRRLAIEEERARRERANAGRETAADKQMDELKNVVRTRAKAAGVQMDDAEVYIAARELENELSAKPGGAGISPSTVFTTSAKARSEMAPMDSDPNAVIQQAAQDAASVMPPAPAAPGTALAQKLDALKRQQQPLNQGQGPVDPTAGPKTFVDDAGVKFTVISNTPLGILLQYQTPDGRTGTTVKGQDQLAPYLGR